MIVAFLDAVGQVPSPDVIHGQDLAENRCLASVDAGREDPNTFEEDAKQGLPTPYEGVASS